MNISTTFLNALKHTSSDVEGQRSPEILLGQIYKVSLEDKGFLLPLAGGEFRLLNPFYYEWNPFACAGTKLHVKNLFFTLEICFFEKMK